MAPSKPMKQCHLQGRQLMMSGLVVKSPEKSVFVFLPCEVGDRWAPGLDSGCLSSGAKLKLCSHPDTPRTKVVAEAELCWNKEIR